MKAEQKKLLFRNSLAVAGSLFFSLTVVQTGGASGSNERYAVMSVNPEGDYADSGSALNNAAFKAIYMPFKGGHDYTKQEFIDYATSFGYTLCETSQEDPGYLVYWLDIGSTSTPTAGSLSSSGATISWTNTGATKNSKINVYVATAAAPTVKTLVAAAAANATSQAITGLTTGTAYIAFVAPANYYGETTQKQVAFTTS